MPIEQRWKDIGVDIPSLLPLGAVPQEWDDAKVLEYLQGLHNYLRGDRQVVVRAINVLSRYRLLITDVENFPDPTGDGTVIVDEDDGTIYVDPVIPPHDHPEYEDPPEWQPIVPEYNTITQEPTGFLNSNGDTTIGISGSNFFIEPTGDSFVFYSGGIKYEVSSQLTLDLSSATTEGNYWITFDGQTGALQLHASVTFEDIIRDNVFVAELYHDGTSLSFLMDERHGLMPWQSHLHAHLADGTVWRSGLGLTGMSMDGTGNLDEHAEADAATGQVMDEDIVHTLPAVSPGDWDLLYLDTGAWEFENGGGGTAPVKQVAGVAQYNDVSTPGSEALAAVTANRFFLMHIFATNLHTDGSGTAVSGHVAILGQDEYLTKTAARAAATTEISTIVTGSLPMPEFLPYATIIYQAKGSNTWGAAAITTDLGEDYVNWLGAEIQPGNPPSSHVNLTDRDAIDQHPLSALEGGSANKFPDASYWLGNMYIDSATPAINLRDNGSATDYSQLYDDGLVCSLKKFAASGQPVIRIDPQVGDGTSPAIVQFLRTTNTAGSAFLAVYAGDGTSTERHRLADNGTVDFCKNGGVATFGSNLLKVYGGTNPEVRIAEGDGSSYLSLRHENQAVSVLEHKAESGYNAAMYFRANPLSGTHGSRYFFGHNIATTGTIALYLYSNVTAVHSLYASGAGSASFCQTGGIATFNGTINSRHNSIEGLCADLKMVANDASRHDYIKFTHDRTTTDLDGVGLCGGLEIPFEIEDDTNGAFEYAKMKVSSTWPSTGWTWPGAALFEISLVNSLVGPGTSWSTLISAEYDQYAGLRMTLGIPLSNNSHIQGARYQSATGADMLGIDNDDQVVLGFGVNPDKVVMSGDKLPIATTVIEVYNDSGSAMAANDVCYISDDHSGTPEVILTDADAESTSAGQLVVLREAISNGASGLATQRGLHPWSQSFGNAAKLWLSTTAGDVTTTQPTGSGDIVRYCGQARDASYVWWDPSQVYIELA
jgi:hypothetical protein